MLPQTRSTDLYETYAIEIKSRTVAGWSFKL